MRLPTPRICLAAIAVATVCAAPAGADVSWDRTWGKDVIISGNFENAEVCVVQDDCQFGNGGNLGGEFQSVSAVASALNGDVYVADPVLNRVSKFDSDGNFLLAFGSGVAGGSGLETCHVGPSCEQGAAGTLGGEMSNPVGVAVDEEGFVYVADTGNNRLQKFLDGLGDVTFVKAWGKGVDGVGIDDECEDAADCVAAADSTGPGGQFITPDSVAVNEDNEVYVGDSSARRVQKFDSSGDWQLAFGKSVVTPGGAGPAEQCVTVANCQNGSAGTLGGEFSTVTGVAADTAEVYVVENSTNRVQRFDPGGAFITAWGKDVDSVPLGDPNVCTVAADCQGGFESSEAGGLKSPRALATDFHGNAYVADSDNQRIQKFDSSGTWRLAWGRGVAGASGFQICTVAITCTAGQAGGLGGDMDGPLAVASDRAGTVYLGEYPNNRIQKFLDVPSSPVMSGTSPASPANDNAPKVQGTAPPGTTVNVYGDASCSGSILATGSDTEFASPGIAAPVPDDSTTTFGATATDETDATSACSSSSVTYVEDSTAPDTVIDTTPVGTIATRMPTFTFHATDPAATFECRFDSTEFAPCQGHTGTHLSVFPLADGAHTFAVRATDTARNADATPASSAFTVDTASHTEPPPAEDLPAPVQGRLVNAVPEKGTVLVKLPAGASSKAHAAAAGFVPLESIGRQLPVGSTLDTTKGTVLLTAATNKSDGTQEGHFSKGIFKLDQTTKNPLTTASMTGAGLNACSKLPRGGSKKVTAAAKKRRRTLFGNVKGRFSTRGRNSTATVRGTQWTMTDTCRGTLTSVKQGSVVVRDFTLKKNKTVKAGHKYLARAPKVKKKRKLR